ncbi:MAG: hypothetical protein BGO98_28575 [Myxococcales bacterium 68-20]|nr:MAG: hypothetical protein BGO98_28575 [Myxococcales bacterium 68-20]
MEGASTSPTGSGSEAPNGMSGAQGTSGASRSSGGFDRDVDVCTGQEHRLLEGVTRSDGSAPADGAVDYMELRDEYELDGSSSPVVVASQGTPCAFGPRTTKCKQDLAALRSAAGWRAFSYGMEPPRHRYLVWTAQDAIGIVTSIDALRDFVKVVENGKDAAFLATATGEYRFVCDGSANAKRTPTGWLLRVQSGHACGEGAKIEEHMLDVTGTGEVTVTQTKLVQEGDPNCAIGRRPEGLASTRARAREECIDPVGRFFTDAAHLEAASVVAFERLASELSMLGAPHALVESALASRDDEIRHARMTAKAARRRGGHPVAPVIEPVARRTMLEIALENAVEGCVRETYGALVAHHQALAASDSSIAAMMRGIAEDETRHAGLAWDVAAWLEPQLSVEDRMTVASARAEALADLRSALGREPGRELEDVAGIPPANRALALLDALEGRFMQPALAAVA